MITSHILYLSDFTQDNETLELCGSGQSPKNEQAFLSLSCTGRGWLTKAEDGLSLKLTGDFSHVVITHEHNEYPWEGSCTSLEVGDVLTLDEKEKIFLLDESSTLQADVENAHQMLGTLLSILRTFPADRHGRNTLDPFTIVKRFSSQLQKALGATGRYVSYSRPGESDENWNVEADTAGKRIHASELIQKALVKVNRTLMIDTSTELHNEYKGELDYDKVLVAPLYRDNKRNGYMMFTWDTPEIAEDTTLMLSTVAVNALDMVLFQNELFSTLNVSTTRTANAANGIGTEAQLSKSFDTIIETRMKPLAKHTVGKEKSILLLGESGSGKGYMAKKFHEKFYGDKKWKEINLMEFSSDLRISKLTGWKKGSFTGAHENYKGVFHEVGDGVLFIDEFGDLSTDQQVALLTMLGSKKYSRVGEETVQDIKCKIVAATNRHLPTLIREGKFREDLLHRFFAVRIPPLNERRYDIAKIIREYLKDNELNMSKDAFNYLIKQDYTEANNWLIRKILDHLHIYYTTEGKQGKWNVQVVRTAWEEVMDLYGGEVSGQAPYFQTFSFMEFDQLKHEYVVAVESIEGNKGLKPRQIAKKLHIEFTTYVHWLGWTPSDREDT
ncbi:sigma 54-interacting transcriptional regulator [bacterium]|nr:sigma 54-interacting transcriptional regulator [bacterium]